MNSTETITCTCKICKTNGVKGAVVPTSLLGAMGRSRKTVHGLVYSANDPSFVGAKVRESLKISAA